MNVEHVRARLDYDRAAFAFSPEFARLNFPMEASLVKGN